MARWYMPDTGKQAVAVHCVDGKWFANAAHRHHADTFVGRHNIDCAAYEATIAELTFDRDSEKRWACQYKAERDAATAQVAELARQTVTLQQDRDTANQRVAELEALCIDNTISVLQGKLSALNATLDRLREVVREYDDQWQDWEPGDLQHLASSVHAILYPQRSKT